MSCTGPIEQDEVYCGDACGEFYIVVYGNFVGNQPTMTRLWDDTMSRVIVYWRFPDPRNVYVMHEDKFRRIHTRIGMKVQALLVMP